MRLLLISFCLVSGLAHADVDGISGCLIHLSQQAQHWAQENILRDPIGYKNYWRQTKASWAEAHPEDPLNFPRPELASLLDRMDLELSQMKAIEKTGLFSMLSFSKPLRPQRMLDAARNRIAVVRSRGYRALEVKAVVDEFTYLTDLAFSFQIIDLYFEKRKGPLNAEFDAFPYTLGYQGSDLHPTYWSFEHLGYLDVTLMTLGTNFEGLATEEQKDGSIVRSPGRHRIHDINHARTRPYMNPKKVARLVLLRDLNALLPQQSPLPIAIEYAAFTFFHELNGVPAYMDFDEDTTARQNLNASEFRNILKDHNFAFSDNEQVDLFTKAAEIVRAFVLSEETPDEFFRTQARLNASPIL